LEKRHYRNGFYFDWNNSTDRSWNEKHSESNVESEPISPSDSLAAVIQVEEPAPEPNNPDLEVAEQVKSSGSEKREDVLVLPPTGVEKTDEPQPESHDRINPLILALTLCAILLPLTAIFGLYLASWFFASLFSLAGLILFVTALLMRKQIQSDIAAGEKKKFLRLSAHYHRIKIILFLFFGGTALFTLGALSLWILGGSGIIGLLMLQSGVVITLAVALILFVLSLIYLIVWRKDPTGSKSRPPKHPPKGG
jgi:hypothetical protein